MRMNGLSCQESSRVLWAELAKGRRQFESGPIGRRKEGEEASRQEFLWQRLFRRFQILLNIVKTHYWFIHDY